VICPHKKGDERFELVTSTLLGMIPARLSYLLRTRSLLFGALLGLGLFIIRSFKDKHVVIFRVV
jgi:hypothetical protein